MSVSTVADCVPTTQPNANHEPLGTQTSVPPWQNPAHVPLADVQEYDQLEHPSWWCAEVWCLARPLLDGQGRFRGNGGFHRTAVRTLEIDFGDVVQVGVGVAEDAGPRVEVPEVHLMLINPDAEGPDEGDSWETRLTADEADQLAGLLRKAVEDLRFRLESQARAEQRAAEQDARAERVPCVVCNEPFPVPVTQRGEPISAAAFEAACAASGMPAKCSSCRSKADEDALDVLQRFLNDTVNLGDR